LGATDVDFEIDKSWANHFPEHGAVYNEGNNRTVFTTAYRLVALDLAEPRIKEGFRITNELLPLMRHSADKLGARFLILIIPTKEAVYADAFKESAVRDSTYKRLVEMEAQAKTEIISKCTDRKINC